ncbi:hypothetical protein HMPREF1003_01968 [Propionibacterium sp. 5_U_42AFAA]|nr:hypothetical protein HMPREF1003_01968 [Propionibacterium sp. 5_U_42AFAA]
MMLAPACDDAGANLPPRALLMARVVLRGGSAAEDWAH